MSGTTSSLPKEITSSAPADFGREQKRQSAQQAIPAEIASHHHRKGTAAAANSAKRPPEPVLVAPKGTPARFTE